MIHQAQSCPARKKKRYNRFSITWKEKFGFCYPFLRCRPSSSPFCQVRKFAEKLWDAPLAQMCHVQPSGPTAAHSVHVHLDPLGWNGLVWQRIHTGPSHKLDAGQSWIWIQVFIDQGFVTVATGVPVLWKLQMHILEYVGSTAWSLNNPILVSYSWLMLVGYKSNKTAYCGEHQFLLTPLMLKRLIIMFIDNFPSYKHRPCQTEGLKKTSNDPQDQTHNLGGHCKSSESWLNHHVYHPFYW